MSDAFLPVERIQDLMDGPGELGPADHGKFMTWDDAAGHMVMVALPKPERPQVVGVAFGGNTGGGGGTTDHAALTHLDFVSSGHTGFEAAGAGAAAVAAHVALANPHSQYLLASAVSAYGLTLVAAADAPTTRGTLGLGALATAGVPGSTTQVIYNSAGALAGDAGMTYDPATDALTVAGRVVTGVWRPPSDSATAVQVQTSAGTALLTIDTSGSRPKWGIGKSTGLVESFEIQSEPDYTTDSFGIRSTFSLAQTSNRTIEHYSSLLAQSIIPSGNSFQPGAWSSAVYAYIKHDGGGTTPDLRTVIAVSRVNSTATVTAMTGFYSDVQLNSTAAIGSFYHFRANPLVKNGTNTVTNEYGFYAGNLTSGTNNYAFYSAGAKSHFANTDFSGTVELNSGSQLLLDGASAAAPSFCFVQTNLGMFRPAANVLGFSVGGAEKMRLTLAGWIGLGTTGPTALLHLAASTAARAQLCLDPTSAADPATPNDGDVWYNSRLKFRRSTTTEIFATGVQAAGGVATAGATYGATEQTMLQAVYNAARTFGLLS